MTLPGLQGDVSSSPDINVFVVIHGRLPKLGDEIPPWRYRGWLLYLVQIADWHPELPGRWGHYMRTLEAGKLLDEPIPQIKFVECPSDKGRKMLEKCLSLMHQRESHWTAFQKFIEWLAWGLAVSGEMPHLEDATNEALYRTFNFEPLLLEPHDYLGSMLAERRSGGWNPHAFYPTPHSICEFMTLLAIGDMKQAGDGDPRLSWVMEPAVGTGRLLLHASNFSYCLFGCDIDPLVTMICRCNAAFYAPWMAFPFPESVVGIPLPPPPPLPLPLPEEHKPANNAPMYRCDDRGQGLLFD
jgi:hypothetical protein